MPDRIIRGRRVENDLWQTLEIAATEPVAALPGGPVLVPLVFWKAHRAELLARRDPTGVWLAPDSEPEDLAQDIDNLTVIAVQFPKWGDGRGYSIGTLLRSRLGYRRELRAFGDLGRDHLFMLARCGFDVFKLGARHDPEKALDAFNDFSVRYQASVDEPLPLFRRRGETTLQ
jgi:uncharacterized protein (DUF934 family)